MTSYLDNFNALIADPDMAGVAMFMALYAGIWITIVLLMYIITSISYMHLMPALRVSKGCAWVPFYRKWLFGKVVASEGELGSSTLVSILYTFGGVLWLTYIGGIIVSITITVCNCIAVFRSRKKRADNEVLYLILSIFFAPLCGFFIRNDIKLIKKVYPETLKSHFDGEEYY